jgi:hypothetical protein
MKKQKLFCSTVICMYNNGKCTLSYNCIIYDGVCEDYMFSESLRMSSKKSDRKLYSKTIKENCVRCNSYKI